MIIIARSNSTNDSETQICGVFTKQALKAIAEKSYFSVYEKISFLKHYQLSVVREISTEYLPF